MTAVYLSSIAYAYGERRSLSSLDEPMPVDLTLPEHGLRYYRETDRETWELAADTIRQSLELGSYTPDLLIYATENDPSTTESLASITRAIQLPKVPYLSIRAHACANFAVGLRLAQDALRLEETRCVLLALADSALGHPRVLTTGLSVFSDGSASCLITLRPTSNRGPQFCVHECVTKIDTTSDPSDPSKTLLSTIRLGKEGIEELMQRTDRTRDQYRHVLFANYRISSQKFLAAAMGFSAETILLGDVAEYAHSFSADLLVNLHNLALSGAFVGGDHLLVSATGPYTWSIMDVEYVGSAVDATRDLGQS